MYFNTFSYLIIIKIQVTTIVPASFQLCKYLLQKKNHFISNRHSHYIPSTIYFTTILTPNMSIIPLQAGLTVGDLLLAVNKDTLLGSTYDSVSIYYL